MKVDEETGTTAADEDLVRARQGTWSGFVKLLTFSALVSAIALVVLAVVAL